MSTTTKKSIFDTVLEARKGRYMHAVEVGDKYELENVAECILQEYEDTHTELEIIEVYFLGDCPELEKEVYDFSFSEFIEGSI